MPQLKDIGTDVNNDDYLKDGDIVMADASEDYEGVGAAVEVVNIGNRKAVGGLHTIVIRLLKDIVAPGFLAFMFSGEQLRNELRKKATGTSVYSVSKTSLKTLTFELPDLSEQIAIAHTLLLSDSELKLKERQLNILLEQQRGLMQSLLTGKIRTV